MKPHPTIALLLIPCILGHPLAVAASSIGIHVPQAAALSNSPFRSQALVAQALAAHRTLTEFPQSRHWTVGIAVGLLAHSLHQPALTSTSQAATFFMGDFQSPVMWVVLGVGAVLHVNGKYPDFKQRPNLHNIVKELAKVARFFKTHPRAGVIFGSARIPEDHYLWDQGKEIGRALYAAKVPPRTGAGPGAMEAPLLGYVTSRNQNGERRTRENQTQGVRLQLKHEPGINPLIESHIVLEHFMPRKYALHRGSVGTISTVGGQGTKDEGLDVWVRGRSHAMLEPASGPFAGHWSEFFSNVQRARDEEGYEDGLDYPYITTDAQDAVDYILKTRSKTWMTRALTWPRMGRQLQRGLEQMDSWDRAVVFPGRPVVGSPAWHAAGELMHELLAAGIAVRISTRGPLVEAAAHYVPEPYFREHLQAVLYLPLGELLRPLEEQVFLPHNRVISNEKSIHSVETLKRAHAIVLPPGGKSTLAKAFEYLTLIQTSKIEYDPPILLLRSQFWRTFMDPAYKRMLIRVPTSEISDRFKIDPETGKPFFSMISRGDETIPHYIDTPKEGFEKITRLVDQARQIPDWHNRPPLAFGPLSVSVLALAPLLAQMAPGVGLALGIVGFAWAANWARNFEGKGSRNRKMGYLSAA